MMTWLLRRWDDAWGLHVKHLTRLRGNTGRSGGSYIACWPGLSIRQRASRPARVPVPSGERDTHYPALEWRCGHNLGNSWAACRSFTPWSHLQSHQDGYKLATVHTHVDFLVPPQWETRPWPKSRSVTLSRYCANHSLSYSSNAECQARCTKQLIRSNHILFQLS